MNSIPFGRGLIYILLSFSFAFPAKAIIIFISLSKRAFKNCKIGSGKRDEVLGGLKVKMWSINDQKVEEIVRNDSLCKMVRDTASHYVTY